MVFCHGIKSHFCIKQCSFHFVITIPFWLIHSFPAICMTGWDQHSSISLQTSGQERWNKLGLSSIGLCLIVMRWIVYCYILSNHIWLPEFLYSKYLFYLNLSLPLFFHLLILSVTLFIYLFFIYTLYDIFFDSHLCSYFSTGAILYFAEAGLSSINSMYETSLDSFLSVFKTALISAKNVRTHDCCTLPSFPCSNTFLAQEMICFNAFKLDWYICTLLNDPSYKASYHLYISWHLEIALIYLPTTFLQDVSLESRMRNMIDTITRQIYDYTCTGKHPHVLTFFTYIHTYIHTYIYIYVHTYTHAYART